MATSATASLPTIRLKPGHVQPVWAGHPWVYAQAVDRVDGAPQRGDEVRVVDPRGNVLGRGFYSPGSALVVRVLVRNEHTPIDAALFATRLRHANETRLAMGIGGEETSGYRVVHAEGDGLPGLIVDRFGDAVVVQFLTFGMKQRQEEILSAINQVLAPKTILDRTPATSAKTEGFEPGAGVIAGRDITALTFRERGLAFEIPLELGQKTGFYFDQREVRARVEAMSKGKRVLDAYSYVGAFGMAAARGGASHVLSVDENALAVEIAASCARTNGLSDRMEFVPRDARRVLADAKGSYDLVIVDPPRLAPTRAAKEKALFAYGKLAELGCRAVKQGGTLVFCSCSAAVDLNMLSRALSLGALRANVQAIVQERMFQGFDHPVSAAFPEGLYLKTLFVRTEPR
jgi:23S rRNA (cytosine1962-C5)-methyltransferase